MRTEGFERSGWQNHLLVIGDPNTGDLFFMNLKDNNSNVYYADHERDFSEENIGEMIYSRSFDDFIGQLLEDLN
jgi:hypothetical protein